MNRWIAVVASALSLAAQADPNLDQRLIDKYSEPDTWSNRANFYFGARGGVAIPAGAKGVAESGGLEIGVANDFGFGFGVHALWMNNPPGAPMFNVPPSQWGLGAMADLRFYFPAIEPLTLYPTLSAGFVAGPSAAGDATRGTNAVLPLINPGIGARVKFGQLYAAFEFGFAGFTVPYVNLCFGFESDRRQQRAEKWAREQLAEREHQRELDQDAERHERLGRRERDEAAPPQRSERPDPSAPIPARRNARPDSPEDPDREWRMPSK